MKSLVIIFAVIVVVSASAQSYVKRADVNFKAVPLKNDYYAYPKYKFEYGVQDAYTGDNKNQWEERDGDVVKGVYALNEADGTKRVVEYYADDNIGFNAVVKKFGNLNHKGYHV